MATRHNATISVWLLKLLIENKIVYSTGSDFKIMSFEVLIVVMFPIALRCYVM
jgi:hypothetical protein